MKVQDLVTIDPWTLIAQLLNLFIQVMLIKKFLFKPIREVLAKRKALADAELADAAKAKEEAEALKSEYEESMKQARDKANDILNTAQKSASQQSEEIIREANAQAVSIKAKAERDIEQERRKAVNEIKDEIGDMAMEIAGKVIGREINSSDHEKLIDDFINKVGEES
ncbi:MAG: F0F1 ATP synthase subunit B [Lachnospiraceae bacterium]|nr:F0F1 ATP synthase subunit B [Lachnospiraceae bacterium]MBR5762553.1 F0F1 ATP synthase subunit B [Lachnospiraceae bacterium]MBR5993018.1 F0F1 ATP synthase subunit B [Lachnospiraceae bacterium]